MPVDHRPPRLMRECHRLAIPVEQRQGARSIAERADHQIGLGDERARLGIVFRDPIQAQARIGRPPAQPQHPHHQFARFQPKPGETQYETADRADVVGVKSVKPSASAASIEGKTAWAASAPSR